MRLFERRRRAVLAAALPRRPDAYLHDAAASRRLDCDPAPRGTTRRRARDDRARLRVNSFFAPPTVRVSPASPPGFRPQGPLVAAERLLRRVDHARAHNPRDAPASSRGEVLQLLGPERGRTARDLAAAGGARRQARFRRSPGPERRDPDGREWSFHRPRR